MLGKSKKAEPKLFYHGISLERRIPNDHPLRRIKQVVDFTSIRSQVAECYGTKGNPSVDPVVILKLMFLLFYEDIKSERALMRQFPLRMDWLWFCEYDLDEQTPNHSVLSKARSRWGMKVFESFFMQILEQCLQAGLIDGKTIYIDSSTIDGHADIDKARPQLRQISQKIMNRLENDDEDGPEEKLERRVNPSDPDARIGSKNGISTLGYKDHRVVDDKHGIITSTITTAANVRDDKVLSESVIQHHFKTRIQAQTAVADKIYGTAANYNYLHEVGMTCCIPHQKPGGRYPGKISIQQFTYQKRQDCFICPAGYILSLCNGANARLKRYRCDRETCEACPFFDSCVSSKIYGRQVERHCYAEDVEWADQCLSSGERHRLMNRRKTKAEGSFADAANNYGFKRARWQGQEKTTIQNLMIAAIQNLGKLLRYGFRKKDTGAGLMALSTLIGHLLPATTTSFQVVMPCVSEYKVFKERIRVSPAKILKNLK